MASWTIQSAQQPLRSEHLVAKLLKPAAQGPIRSHRHNRVFSLSGYLDERVISASMRVHDTQAFSGSLAPSGPRLTFQHEDYRFVEPLGRDRLSHSLD